MFDDVVIVQSAVSAFNNAALAAPAFLWWGLLAIPVFFMTYFCGNAFLDKIGWTRDRLLNRVSVATVALTLCWVILFSGNYGVLRDAASVLPFMVAAIVFVSSLFIGSNMRGAALPVWRGTSRSHKLKMTAFVAVVLLAVGLSDTHAWWGPILQIGALVGGMLLGRAMRGVWRAVAGTVLVVIATSVAILMQPEFFRFGQLGSLTIAHLGALMAVGVLGAATVALRNVAPHGRIHDSAYVKLKWMARFLTLFCMALFILTESVPVFLGMIAVAFLSFALSIFHVRVVSVSLSGKMFAAMLGAFGIITTMPAITVLGILYWINQPNGNFWRESGFLL